MKLYFQKHGEKCISILAHLGEMEENNEEMRELFQAKIEKGADFFYCKNYDEVGEKGECGKSCEAYAPRNGKSGICKHTGDVYDQTEIKKVIINKYYEAGDIK